MRSHGPPFVACAGRSDRRVQGFTLVEFLAVLLLLATAFAIALPALTAGSVSEIRAAARTVAAGLRQTRERAIATNRAVVMRVDVENRRIGMDNRSHQLPKRVRVGLVTARGERIDGTRGAIRFFPDGSSTGGRVTLATDSRSILVDVDWLTGRVSMRDGDPVDWGAPTPFESVSIR